MVNAGQRWSAVVNEMRLGAVLAVVVASCGAGNAEPTEPIAVAAEIEWLLSDEHPPRPPVMLVGDTLTFRPQLLDVAGETIATAPSDWAADYDSAVLSFEAFRAQALAPTLPGRSTALLYSHAATALEAAIEIVVLDP